MGADDVLEQFVSVELSRMRVALIMVGNTQPWKVGLLQTRLHGAISSQTLIFEVAAPAKKILRTTGNFTRCKPVSDLHVGFKIPCL
jgi:hypothetical protein